MGKPSLFFGPNCGVQGSKIFSRVPRGGGGGYCLIWAIYVFATVKGMVLKQFTLV